MVVNIKAGQFVPCTFSGLYYICLKAKAYLSDTIYVWAELFYMQISD